MKHDMFDISREPSITSNSDILHLSFSLLGMFPYLIHVYVHLMNILYIHSTYIMFLIYSLFRLLCLLCVFYVCLFVSLACRLWMVIVHPATLDSFRPAVVFGNSCRTSFGDIFTYSTYSCIPVFLAIASSFPYMDLFTFITLVH